MNKFYITTTLPYVNAKPHIGHAKEFVIADVVARYRRLLGDEVIFNTGTDEHGKKVLGEAEKEGLSAQEYVDKLAEPFKGLVGLLNLSNTHFIRTTSEEHKKAAQEFWKLVDANGYIYKKQYQSKYCVGCELEKTDSELVDGKCELHPNREIELIDEENYFFKFSEFQNDLLELYKRESFVVPDFRLNEIRTFVEGGLQDFSISRLKEKLPWGVEVPGDPDHVMYVWFDALVNYISTLGWPEGGEYDEFWPGTQICGKDNLRQQAAIWQAMLLAAGLPNSERIIVQGFITGEGGVKMSKSLGNVIDPEEIVNEYGTDALRYFLLRELSTYEDSPFTKERFAEAYNANLVNGIGNLTARVLKLAEDNLDAPVEIPGGTIPREFKDLLDKFEIQKATDFVWGLVGELDEEITRTEPFKLVKENKTAAQDLIASQVVKLYTIARCLNPLLPETSDKIKAAVKANKKPESLFERK